MNFNELDFRSDKKKEKSDLKASVADEDNVKSDKKKEKNKSSKKKDKKFNKKIKSSPLLNLKSSGGKHIRQKSSMATDLDAAGYFPPQRDFQAYFYDIIMSVLLLISASSFFFLFRQTVNGDLEGIQSWLLPILSISFFIVLLLIYSITVHIKEMLLGTIFASFAISLFFALQIWHGLVIILSFLITYWTVHQMRKALLDSAKINVGNLVRLGISGIIFSVIFVMCSQYYWMVHDRGVLDLMPRFDKVSISGNILGKFVKTKNAEGEGSSKITVDEFLLMSVKGEGDQNLIENEQLINVVDENESQEDKSMFGGFLSNIGIDKDKVVESVGSKVEDVKMAGSEKVDEIVVETMRKNLSKQLGRELSGEEYIADVFDDMMYEKIAGWFSKNKNGDTEEEGRVSYLALFLTILLFVSALTLKAILRPFIVLLVVGLFWILRKINFIKVTKVKRETEMIISQSSV